MTASRAEPAPDLEERALVDDRLDDRADLVDLAAVLRGTAPISQSSAALGVVVGRGPLGQLVDRGRQVGQEAAGALEGLVLAVDDVVDGAVARRGSGRRPAPPWSTCSPIGRDQRRPGDEDLASVADHQRVVAGRDPRGAEPGARAEGQRRRPARCRGCRRPLPARVGRARRCGPSSIEAADAAAAAGAVDQAHERQAQLVGHLLGVDLLLADGTRRTAPPAHGEVVAGHHHAAGRRSGRGRSRSSWAGQVGQPPSPS